MKAATCVLLAVALARAGATGPDGSECAYITRPPSPTPPPPPPVDCELYTVVSDPNPWGPCKLADDYSGKYFRTKILSVKTQPANGGKACPGKDDPVRLAKEQCPPINCTAKTPEQDLDNPFGPCTDDGTGVFYRNKTLGVAEDAQNGGSCDPAERLYKELCEAKPCVVNTPEEDNGTFTECFQDNSTYTARWIKTKVLQVKTPAENGGSCPSKAERTLTEVCPPVNCIPVTPEEDTKPFGDCTELAGTNTYFRYKVLDVKVNATYGGTCDKKDRTISEFCKPVDCVANTPDEDEQPFGNCTQLINTGKYYKSKVLGIKQPALYGGKQCDPKNLTLSVLCPAVDCVVNTLAEDKGNFSATCKLIGNEYYKTKVLDIKTPPLYGGKACPSEADRTVKQLCPNDGYCVPTDTFYDTCIPKLAQCSAQRKGVEYEGGQISVTEGLAIWQCCDKCTTTAGCKAYTFYPAAASNYGAGKKSKCYLWWEVTDKDDGYGSVVSSSPKSPKPAACEYYDNRWLGTVHSEIKGFDTDDLDRCCTACKATSGCVAFELSSGYCSLRKTTGVRVPWFNTKVGYPI